MMDEGDKEKIHAQFSLLDARSRKRNRSSVVITLVLISVTGLLVLRLARDIVEKQAQVQSVERSRGDLDKRLRSEQEKVDEATRSREKLEAEIKELEATKKSYQNRILSEKDAHNEGSMSAGAMGVTAPHHMEARVKAQQDDFEAESSPRALLIEESGKAPEGFVMTPKVTVTPGRGISGREIYKVHVWLDLPEAKRGDIERVTYHLSPKYYLKNVIEAGSAPTFEANFNVFACESTVLARVKLRGGATLAVDFDWCSFGGWPDRKKEPVIVTSEEEKIPGNIAMAPGSIPPKKPADKPPVGTAAPPSPPVPRIVGTDFR